MSQIIVIYDLQLLEFRPKLRKYLYNCLQDVTNDYTINIKTINVMLSY